MQQPTERTSDQPGPSKTILAGLQRLVRQATTQRDAEQVVETILETELNKQGVTEILGPWTAMCDRLRYKNRRVDERFATLLELPFELPFHEAFMDEIRTIDTTTEALFAAKLILKARIPISHAGELKTAWGIACDRTGFRHDGVTKKIERLLAATALDRAN